ncbi:hypothetical protein ACLOJK_010470 [Asimina triloba]
MEGEAASGHGRLLKQRYQLGRNEAGGYVFRQTNSLLCERTMQLLLRSKKGDKVPLLISVRRSADLAVESTGQKESSTTGV